MVVVVNKCSVARATSTCTNTHGRGPLPCASPASCWAISPPQKAGPLLPPGSWGPAARIVPSSGVAAARCIRQMRTAAAALHAPPPYLPALHLAAPAGSERGAGDAVVARVAGMRPALLVPDDALLLGASACSLSQIWHHHQLMCDVLKAVVPTHQGPPHSHSIPFLGGGTSTTYATPAHEPALTLFPSSRAVGVR